MSSVFSKNKEKRSRTSSDERNNSFVKNVTSRVSGLLPSAITKWFSSPSSSNANGSAQTADATDSSTEDEGSDAPVITQPPAKRMRYSSPGKYNHYGPLEGNCSTSNLEMSEILFESTQYVQTTRSTLSTSVQAADDPGIPKKNIEKETTYDTYKPDHTVDSKGQSVATKRKSIFSTSKEELAKAAVKSSANTITDLKQPRFKASFFGSPFYSGRTMYGGAASSYLNQANIKQHTVAVVKEPETNDNPALSNSVRKVLDLLESYSSPLSEARRIPLYTKPKNNFNTSDPYVNKRLSYKHQELYVPNHAKIMKVTKKSRLMDTTNVARQIMASHSSSNNYPYTSEHDRKAPEKEQANKMTTKVKPRVTRSNRRNQDDFEVVSPIELPTGVLQIDQDKLPKFSFDKSASQSSDNLKALSQKDKLTADDENHTQATPTTSKFETFTTTVFSFSKPLQISTDSCPLADITPPHFDIDGPEPIVETPPSKCVESSITTSTVKENEKPTVDSNDWQCPDCWVKNKSNASKCVCCGAKQPSKNAKCSVCKLADSQAQKDKCINCEKIPVTQEPNSLIIKPAEASQSTKWKCNDCWVSNEETAVKCACCGGGKPKTLGLTEAKATASSIAVTNQTMSGTTNGDWKCDECWISNKGSVEKCAACGSARPGAKRNSVAPVARDTSNFFGSSTEESEKIPPKVDSWECPCCLVKNQMNRAICICCTLDRETLRPAPKFNFQPRSTFGVDPEDTKTTDGELEPKLKEKSETNNNSLAETPTFKFILPTKKTNESINDVSKTKTEEATIMSFKFGIPKDNPTVNVANNKQFESEKIEEEPQTVPAVDLNSIQDKADSLGKLVDPTLMQINNDTKFSIANSTILSNTSVLSNTDTKQETSTNSINLFPPATSASEKPLTFTFGVKPSNQMFNMPATTAASMNLLTSTQTLPPSTQALPPSTQTLPPSASTLSLFKPPETTMATTMFKLIDTPVKPVLFQNSEPTKSATTGPVFSFGSNGSGIPKTAPVSAPEQPKFQFTFGNNSASKTDPATALFKSPFGNTESNMSTPNKFTLPTGSTLNSTNTLGTNTLGGNNGLSAANGLPGSTLGALAVGNQITGNTTTATSNLAGPNSLSNLPLSGGNGLQPTNALTGSIFGNAVQKDMWSANNNAPSGNLFVSNTGTNTLQKPPTFTFGSFNAGATAPAFGNNAAPPQNMFGMSNQTANTQQSMFSNPVSSPQTGNLFGAPTLASNPTPQVVMFGTPNIGAAPAFGTLNPPLPAFEAHTITPTPAPQFNFGGVQSPGIFGYAQQPQLQQPQLQQPQLQQPQSNQQQAGIYNFGAASPAPQVQFSIGSGANTAVRRVRKAVRRNPQR